MEDCAAVQDIQAKGVFSLIALLMAAVSTVMMVPVLLEYFSTGLVPRLPTLIVSGFIALAAIQSFFSGMILEEMTWKDRRDFEYRYNRVAEQKRNSR